MLIFWRGQVKGKGDDQKGTIKHQQSVFSQRREAGSYRSRPQVEEAL
jgi:hypothetical protein